MEVKEIEHKIACNELNAAQVYTQMKQHIDASIERTKLVNELIDSIQWSGRSPRTVAALKALSFREYWNEYHRKYYQANKEKIRARQAEYYRRKKA